MPARSTSDVTGRRRSTGSSAKPSKKADSVLLAPGSVEEGVRNELLALQKRDPRLVSGAQAASALELARQMDSGSSATSKSMVAKALNETMAALHAQAPPEEVADRLDELSKRREARLARGSGT